jgi:hypothetical protein
VNPYDIFVKELTKRTISLTSMARVSSKKITFLWIIAVSCLLTCQGLNAQDSLSIESFSIPDTVEFNESIQVSFTVLNQSPASRTGNLRFFLRNESNNDTLAQLSNFTALQFFAPFQPRTFQFPIEINDAIFRLGGNTVVIWPSFVGNPDGQNGIEKEIYVRDINEVQSIKKLKENLQIYPNPFTNQITINKTLPHKALFILKNLQGQTIPISNKLAAGIYIAELYVENERIYNQLVVRIP